MRGARKDKVRFSARDRSALCCDMHFRWPWSDASREVGQEDREVGADAWRGKGGYVSGDEGRWKAQRFPPLMTWVMFEKDKVLRWRIWGKGEKHFRGGRAGCPCRPNPPSYTGQTLEVRKDACTKRRKTHGYPGCPLSLVSHSLPITTGILCPSHLANPQSRALLAHAPVMPPMGPDTRKPVRRLEPEGSPPVDAHLSSADQILFVAHPDRCGRVTTPGVRASAGGKLLPLRRWWR